MYSFSLNDEHCMLVIVVTGFMQIEDVRRFNLEVREMIAKAHQKYGRIRVMADVRAAPPQPKEAIAEWDNPGLLLNADERYALVTTFALAKMQAKRVVVDGRSRIFDEIEEAKAWLLEN